MKQLAKAKILLVLFALAASRQSGVLAYDYNESDPTAGAGPEAPWRDVARWDAVDEVSTREIHRFTTEPRYITPLVSYVPEDSIVPSPRDVLGYTVGTEGILTRPDDEIRYFTALAEASPNVRLLEMGRTEEGRTMHLVVVSDAANLVRLAEFKRNMRALSDPRITNRKDAQALVQSTKPIMHITAGLHSPETGPPEMVMELAYRVAVSKHPDIVKMRENVVLLITPITDVDGRAKVVDWYYRHLQDYDDRRYMPSISPPYWGKYVFHDNNRDGIQISQALTKNYIAAFYEWLPVYSLDLHESVPLLYVAGGTGPYNPALDPIVVREWQWAAHYELAELQRHNLPGVWTWGFYTGWNPSYLLWVTNNHNSMGRFYETFGNSSAKTMERDLSDAKFAGQEVTTEQWYRADPPDKNVVWSLRNNTNYMQSGVLASLKLLSENGPTFLENFYQKSVNSIERGKTGAPYGWAIPAKQSDSSRVAYLVNQLGRHGIEVVRAVDDFELEDGAFSSGDFLVRLDQPYADFARSLLTTRLFPKDAEHKPYDDVSWALGDLYGVDTKPIKDKRIFEVASVEPVDANVSIPGIVSDGDPEAYVLKHTGQNTQINARYKLGRLTVYATDAAFEAKGETYPAGSWIIPHRRGLKGQLQQIADEQMLSFSGLDAIPEVARHEIDLPRFALYHNWVRTQDDGWVRFTLEQFDVPYSYINDDTIRGGNLRSRYDVILMAHQGGADAKTLIHGRDPKFGAQAYTATREFPSHGAVDDARDITGGIGFEGMRELEEFLDSGGTLVLLGSAGQLATETGLIRNVSVDAGAGVQTPGSTLTTKVLRPDHPAVYGFDAVSTVFRVNGPVYKVPKEYDHWIVLQYGTKPIRNDEEEAPDSEDSEAKPEDSKFLIAGYINDASKLEKSGAIIDVPRSAGGRVILYSFDPFHRYLNHADFNYVFNVLMHWNDIPAPTPKDHPMLVKD